MNEDEQQIEESLLAGFKMVCDECDLIGSNDYGYPHWQLQNDGRVLCMSCADNEN